MLLEHPKIDVTASNFCKLKVFVSSMGRRPDSSSLEILQMLLAHPPTGSGGCDEVEKWTNDLDALEEVEKLVFDPRASLMLVEAHEKLIRSALRIIVILLRRWMLSEA